MADAIAGTFLGMDRTRLHPWQAGVKEHRHLAGSRANQTCHSMPGVAAVEAAAAAAAAVVVAN